MVDALRCATEVQAGMAERNAGIRRDRRLEFRIGVNVGDIVVEDGDIFGDGVKLNKLCCSRTARLSAVLRGFGLRCSSASQPSTWST